MKILKTPFKDLLVIKNEKFTDNRGYFREILVEKNLKKRFPFNVVSISKKNVIRGLHYQKPMQAKLVFVIKGKIQDIVLDIDKNSKTFGKYYQFILSEKDKLLYIPKRFAHGFCALEKSEIIYVLGKNYKNENQYTIKWDDKDLNIKWMTKKPIISNKDKNGKKFKSI